MSITFYTFEPVVSGVCQILKMPSRHLYCCSEAASSPLPHVIRCHPLFSFCVMA